MNGRLRHNVQRAPFALIAALFGGCASSGLDGEVAAVESAQLRLASGEAVGIEVCGYQEAMDNSDRTPAPVPAGGEKSIVMGDIDRLKTVGAVVLHEDKALDLAVAIVAADQMQAYEHGSDLSHDPDGLMPLADVTGRTDEDIRRTFDARSPLAAIAARVRENEEFEAALTARARPTAPTDDECPDPEICAAMKDIVPANISAVVERLSSYKTRYHDAPPYDYIDYLEGVLNKIAEDAGRAVEVRRITHAATRQPSLCVRIAGAGDKASEVVILGAHLDSINLDPAQETHGIGIRERTAPGADDNASGVAVLIEAYRNLVAADPNKQRRTVEFHFYAGEERRFLGSMEIANAYDDANADVVGYLNFDMVMFAHEASKGKIHIAQDAGFLSPWMFKYLESLVANYIGAEVSGARCGDNSDHRSWILNGFSAAWVVEGKCSFGQILEKRHTAEDRFDLSILSEKHAATFSALAVVYALHLANSELRGE